MRAVLPVLTVSALALVLAGCTPAPEGEEATSEECVPAASGSVSDAVTVTGDAGADPSVSFESPLEVDETEVTVVTEGDGELVEPGSLALLDFSLYNAATGELASSTGHGVGTSVQLPVDETQTIAGMVKTVECAHVGDRIVSVVTAADAFGEAGYADLGIEAGDPVVFVVDVVDIVPTRADGEEQPAPEGFPEVEFDDDGRPTVTVPDEEPPTELRIALLREGDGATVEEGDSVTVQYQGVNWETGEIFDESWGRAPATFTTTGVVSGFAEALVGEAVGSTVIAVLPPDEAYGEESEENESQLAGQTLVFVIDILATQSAG